MDLNSLLILISTAIFICGFIVFLGLKIYKSYTVIKRIKSFSDYLAVLEFHLSKAYAIIHKDRILVYSLDAMRIPDEEFVAISHDFVNLVLKMIGPSLQSEFINLYGNQDTFIFNLVEYFNTRYEEDEIRKQSIDEITSEEPEEPQYDLQFGPHNRTAA